jgi:hypothetical protein
LSRDEFVDLANSVLADALAEVGRLNSEGDAVGAAKLLKTYNDLTEWLNEYDGE